MREQALVSAVVLLLVLVVPGVRAQAPSVAFEVTDPTAAGASWCGSVEISNTGATGYGPYLRLVLSPELLFGLTAESSGEITPSFVGTFPGSETLTDPLIGTPVTGPVGGTLVIAKVSAASLADGASSTVIICSHVPELTTAGTTVDLAAQPVFELGDTPEGTNGPIVGSQGSVSVPVIEPLVWRWDFDTEHGRLLSDGALSDTTGAFTFTVAGYAVGSSVLNFTPRACYWENQPSQGFVWNGSAPTQFFRNSGMYTNGSNYFHIPQLLVYSLNADSTSASGILETPDRRQPYAAGPLSLTPRGILIIFADDFEDGTTDEWSSVHP